MTTIVDQIIAGAKLVATPPDAIGGRWTFALDKRPVLLSAGQFLAVQRSTLISVVPLAANKLLYRAMTKEERKSIREQYRAWQRKEGKK